ncbi:MAG: glycosyltransferase family 4 protein, partial [Oscillochloris sp.]|nr:glycosyltransferase family 4 protein [Oscillochloris sp.]
MRLLFVCAEVPTPQHIRSYGILQALAGRGHQITVVCNVAPGTHHAIADLWERGIHVLAVAQGQNEQRRSMVRALTSRLPLAVASVCNPRLLASIRDEVASGDYAVAHISGLAASGLGQALGDMPTVLDAGTCASLTLNRRSREGWQQSIRAALGIVRTRRHEGEYGATYRRIIASSPDDAWALAMLAGHYGTHSPGIHVVPTPIAPDAQVSSILTLREQESLLLCSDKASRAQATLRLAESVMPQIWRQRADVKLLVAGPLPAPLRRSSAEPRIISIGSNNPQAVGRATIALAPDGSESADSALHALSCGTPLIASHMIGRALAGGDGRTMLLADEPTKQARAV